MQETQMHKGKKLAMRLISLVVAVTMVTSGSALLFSYAEASTGGPDSQGYSWTDSDEAGNENLYSEYFVDCDSLGSDSDSSNDCTSSYIYDDGTVTISLPYSVKYYFADYDSVSVNNNGCLGFGGSPSCSYYDTSPSTSNSGTPKMDVAHDDWYYYSNNAGSTTYGTYIDHTETSHPDHGDGYFVQWTDKCMYGLSSCQMYGEFTFSTALFADGTIVAMYSDWGTGATSSSTIRQDDPVIGLSQGDGSNGLDYRTTNCGTSCNGDLAGGDFAVMFMPPSWALHDLVMDENLVGAEELPENFESQFGAVVKNMGLNDEDNVAVEGTFHHTTLADAMNEIMDADTNLVAGPESGSFGSSDGTYDCYYDAFACSSVTLELPADSVTNQVYQGGYYDCSYNYDLYYGVSESYTDMGIYLVTASDYYGDGGMTVDATDANGNSLGHIGPYDYSDETSFTFTIDGSTATPVEVTASMDSWWWEGCLTIDHTVATAIPGDFRATATDQYSDGGHTITVLDGAGNEMASGCGSSPWSDWWFGDGNGWADGSECSLDFTVTADTLPPVTMRFDSDLYGNEGTFSAYELISSTSDWSHDTVVGEFDHWATSSGSSGTVMASGLKDTYVSGNLFEGNTRMAEGCGYTWAVDYAAGTLFRWTSGSEMSQPTSFDINGIMDVSATTTTYGGTTDATEGSHYQHDADEMCHVTTLVSDGSTYSEVTHYYNADLTGSTDQGNYDWLGSSLDSYGISAMDDSQYRYGFTHNPYGNFDCNGDGSTDYYSYYYYTVLQQGDYVMHFRDDSGDGGTWASAYTSAQGSYGYDWMFKIEDHGDWGYLELGDPVPTDADGDGTIDYYDSAIWFRISNASEGFYMLWCDITMPRTSVEDGTHFVINYAYDEGHTEAFVGDSGNNVIHQIRQDGDTTDVDDIAGLGVNAETTGTTMTSFGDLVVDDDGNVHASMSDDDYVVVRSYNRDSSGFYYTDDLDSDYHEYSYACGTCDTWGATAIDAHNGYIYSAEAYTSSVSYGSDACDDNGVSGGCDLFRMAIGSDSGESWGLMHEWGGSGGDAVHSVTGSISVSDDRVLVSTGYFSDSDYANTELKVVEYEMGEYAVSDGEVLDYCWSNYNYGIPSCNAMGANERTFEFTYAGTAPGLTLTAEVDYWYGEGSYNILLEDGSYYFNGFQTFSSPYGINTHDISDLPAGSHGMVIRDSYGDGGQQGSITCDGCTYGGAFTAEYGLAPPSQSYLMSPAADLSDAVGDVTLTFDHSYQFYETYDGAYLEVTNDGGETWALVEPDGGYTGVISDSPVAGSTGWTGPGPNDAGATSGDYESVSVDLTSYAGDTIHMRWTLGWSALQDADFNGWYRLDNVVISQEVLDTPFATLNSNSGTVSGQGGMGGFILPGFVPADHGLAAGDDFYFKATVSYDNAAEDEDLSNNHMVSHHTVTPSHDIFYNFDYTGTAGAGWDLGSQEYFSNRDLEVDFDCAGLAYSGNDCINFGTHANAHGTDQDTPFQGHGFPWVMSPVFNLDVAYEATLSYRENYYAYGTTYLNQMNPTLVEITTDGGLTWDLVGESGSCGIGWCMSDGYELVTMDLSPFVGGEESQLRFTMQWGPGPRLAEYTQIDDVSIDFSAHDNNMRAGIDADTERYLVGETSNFISTVRNHGLLDQVGSNIDASLTLGTIDENVKYDTTGWENWDVDNAGSGWTYPGRDDDGSVISGWGPSAGGSSGFGPGVQVLNAGTYTLTDMASPKMNIHHKYQFSWFNGAYDNAYAYAGGQVQVTTDDPSAGPVSLFGGVQGGVPANSCTWDYGIAADAGSYMIKMWDSYGDGWNWAGTSGSVNVYNSANGMLIASLSDSAYWSYIESEFEFGGGSVDISACGDYWAPYEGTYDVTSVAQGANWVALEPDRGYDGQCNGAYQGSADPNVCDTDAFIHQSGDCGDSCGGLWIEDTFDLSAYLGETVHIRFYAGIDQYVWASDNVQWMIDDFSIMATSLVASPGYPISLDVPDLARAEEATFSNSWTVMPGEWTARTEACLSDAADCDDYLQDSRADTSFDSYFVHTMNGAEEETESTFSQGASATSMIGGPYGFSYPTDSNFGNAISCSWGPPSAGYYFWGRTFEDVQLDAGQYVAIMQDSFGDGWNYYGFAGGVEITDSSGNVIASDTFPSGTLKEVYFNVVGGTYDITFCSDYWGYWEATYDVTDVVEASTTVMTYNTGWSSETVSGEAAFEPSSYRSSDGDMSWFLTDDGAGADNVRLVSAPIDLTGATHAILTFEHQYNFAAGDGGGVIEISADGGTTWERLTPTAGHGYSGTVDGSGDNPLPYNTQAFAGTGTGYYSSDDWYYTEATINNYVGQEVLISFMFGGDNADDPGYERYMNYGFYYYNWWFIDNIKMLTRGAGIEMVSNYMSYRAGVGETASLQMAFANIGEGDVGDEIGALTVEAYVETDRGEAVWSSTQTISDLAFGANTGLMGFQSDALNTPGMYTIGVRILDSNGEQFSDAFGKKSWSHMLLVGMNAGFGVWYDYGQGGCLSPLDPNFDQTCNTEMSMSSAWETGCGPMNDFTYSGCMNQFGQSYNYLNLNGDTEELRTPFVPLWSEDSYLMFWLWTDVSVDTEISVWAHHINTLYGGSTSIGLTAMNGFQLRDGDHSLMGDTMSGSSYGDVCTVENDWTGMDAFYTAGAGKCGWTPIYVHLDSNPVYNENEVNLEFGGLKYQNFYSFGIRVEGTSGTVGIGGIEIVNVREYGIFIEKVDFNQRRYEILPGETQSVEYFSANTGVYPDQVFINPELVSGDPDYDTSGWGISAWANMVNGVDCGTFAMIFGFPWEACLWPRDFDGIDDGIWDGNYAAEYFNCVSPPYLGCTAPWLPYNLVPIGDQSGIFMATANFEVTAPTYDWDTGEPAGGREVSLYANAFQVALQEDLPEPDIASFYIPPSQFEIVGDLEFNRWQVIDSGVGHKHSEDSFGHEPHSLMITANAVNHGNYASDVLVTFYVADPDGDARDIPGVGVVRTTRVGETSIDRMEPYSVSGMTYQASFNWLEVTMPAGSTRDYADITMYAVINPVLESQDIAAGHVMNDEFFDERDDNSGTGQVTVLAAKMATPSFAIGMLGLIISGFVCAFGVARINTRDEE